MYRPYLIAILFSFGFAPLTRAAEPTVTPTPIAAPDAKRLVDQISAEEKEKANDLWNQAMEAFSARSYKVAAKLLNTYVEKYPGTTEAIDARYSLAQSYLYSKQPAAAIPFFTAVIEIRGRSPLGNEARTYLGQAYLDDQKFSEAYLVSEELLSQDSLGTTFRAKALLLRAHAQAGLKQNLEAEKTLVTFQTVAESDPELESEIAGSFLVSVLLKANHCDSLPSSKFLTEDQVIDQLSRKGICVLEMATYLAKAAKRLSEDELSAAGDALAHSLNSYRLDCESPPLAPGKLPAAKAKVARNELSEKLLDGYRSSEKLLRESFRERENLKSILKKLEVKPTVKKI